MSARTLGLYLCVLVAAVPLAAQQREGAAWPWDKAPVWHALLDWRSHPAASSSADLLLVARAELELGRPKRASGLLADPRFEDSSWAGPALAVRAMVATAERRYGEAASFFARAGARASDTTRGLLAARAGAAFERAGLDARAVAAYEEAKEALPPIGGWLALRIARLEGGTVPARSVPPGGRPLARQAAAYASLRRGDTATAISALRDAGATVAAARLSLAVGDTALARRLKVEALRSGDTALVRRAASLSDTTLPPAAPDEWMARAEGAAALGNPREAAHLAARARAAGDTGLAVILAEGGWLEAAGERRAALALYRHVRPPATARGDEVATRRGRLLARLGQRTAARRELIALVRRRPSSRRAPYALFLAADLSASDSLFQVVRERWPQSEWASQARHHLASSALTRGDTAAAIAFLAEEVRRHGGGEKEARYLLARIREAQGDTTVADAVLVSLAHDDSLGYYGYAARQAARLPAPVFAPTAAPASPDSLRTLMVQLDLLDAAGFEREARLLVDYMLSHDWQDAEQTLVVGEGLAKRGRVAQGISLGWRAASENTLNDGRVLRAIFPWPDRRLVVAEARKFGLDPYLLAGLIRQESSFQAEAKSRAGARGLMQLMPSTARGVARRLGVPWTDAMIAVPDANVHIGAAHLAALIRRFRGARAPAVAAYNAGGSAVARWLAARPRSDDALWVERIPYTETQNYVRAVLRNAALYRALYPEAGR